MKSGRLSNKSQAILEALAKGRSCEQILAADRTLTYHDIFRAAAEIPEAQLHWKWPRDRREGSQNQAKSGGRGAEHEALSKARD